MTILAVSLAGAAVALCFPALERLTPRRRPPTWVAAPATACCIGLLMDGWALASGLVVVLFGIGAVVLARRDRARGRADVTRRQLVEAAEALASELRAGQPPSRALERAADVWPPLGKVASAVRVGADVPDAFRRLGEQRGGEALTSVAAAWSLSDRLGTGLAEALDRVVAQARGELETRRVLAGELAAAQATARMVALMPVALLALSGGTGGDPWRFLLATRPGLACLGLGLALVLVGLWWLDRIVSTVEAGR